MRDRKDSSLVVYNSSILEGAWELSVSGFLQLFCQRHKVMKWSSIKQGPISALTTSWVLCSESKPSLIEVPWRNQHIKNCHHFLWVYTFWLVSLVYHWYTSQGMWPSASEFVFVSPTDNTGLWGNLDLKSQAVQQWIDDQQSPFEVPKQNTPMRYCKDSLWIMPSDLAPWCIMNTLVRTWDLRTIFVSPINDSGIWDDLDLSKIQSVHHHVHWRQPSLTEVLWRNKLKRNRHDFLWINILWLV